MAALKPPPKEEVYGAETWYRELGYYITSRKEQYERACKYFDTAVEKAPNDKRALLGRSVARAKAVQYEGAMDDINRALAIDPEDLVSLAQKSLYTYLCCNFEEALVSNLSCRPKRQKPDNFVMGVMHCTEAIENCLGTRAGRPLRDHFKIIRVLAWKKAKESAVPYVARQKRKKKRRKRRNEGKRLEALAPLGKKRKGPWAAESDINLKIFDSVYSHKEELDTIPPGPYFPYKPLQDYTSNIENYMASKYLESMYLDKIFLKNLKDDRSVKNPNETSTKKIWSITKHGYKALSYKQELLRVRRPFYFIKFQEMTLLSPTLLARQMKEDERMREVVQSNAKILLRSIEHCIKTKQTRLALELAEKLKIMCETKQKKFFPDRQEYLKQIYTLVAKAHLELKRLNKSQIEQDQVKRIYNMLGYPLTKQLSKDSVLKEFKDVFIDWKKQIAIAENRVKNAKEPNELAWLYHDLSRYHTEIKQYELARVYARKCIAEAKEIHENTWILNATLLIVRINMQLRNKTDAKQELNTAIELSKEMHNENLTEYLNKAMTVIEGFNFDDVSTKVHEKREKKIIDLMATSAMKGEVEHLFRMMAVMPAARRMSVMPGVRFPDDPKKKSQKKQTILPTSVKDEVELYQPKRKKNAKNETKDEECSGKEFMKLMQFHID